jgi:hypothetical protein
VVQDQFVTPKDLNTAATPRGNPCTIPHTFLKTTENEHRSKVLRVNIVTMGKSDRTSRRSSKSKQPKSIKLEDTEELDASKHNEETTIVTEKTYPELLFDYYDGVIKPHLTNPPKEGWKVKALVQPVLPTSSGGLGVTLNLSQVKRDMLTTSDGHLARTVEPNNAYANKIINIVLHISAQVHDIAAEHGKKYEVTQSKIIRLVYRKEVDVWYKASGPAETKRMITRFDELFEKVMRGFNPVDPRAMPNELLVSMAAYYARIRLGHEGYKYNADELAAARLAVKMLFQECKLVGDVAGTAWTTPFVALLQGHLQQRGYTGITWSPYKEEDATLRLARKNHCKSSHKQTLEPDPDGSPGKKRKVKFAVEVRPKVKEELQKMIDEHREMQQLLKTPPPEAGPTKAARCNPRTVDLNESTNSTSSDDNEEEEDSSEDADLDNAEL